MRLAKAAEREEGALALLLAREACLAADREECRTALYGALARSGALPVFRHERASVWACGMPRNAELVYTLDGACLRIWRPDGSPVAEIPAATESPPWQIGWWAFDHARIGLVYLDARQRTLAGLYDASGQAVAALPHDEPPRGVWIGGKGGLVVTWTDRTVRFWDGSGRAVAAIPHPRDVRVAYPRLDGRKVVTVTSRRARVFDAAGRELAAWEVPDSVAGVRWATATDRLLLRSDGNVARLWDANGRPRGALELHTQPLTEARFSLDGELIVTSSLDGRAILWNALGEPLRILRHAFPVQGVEFLPRGQHLVTFGRNEAWLWSRRGRLVARLRGHRKEVKGVGYSGQADRVVTCAGDGTALLWPIDPGEALALAARRAGRELTAEERQTHGAPAAK